MPKPEKGAREGGFVQLLVLGGLASISAVLTVALTAMVWGAREAAAVERLVRADALLAGGFNRMLAAIRSPDDTLEADALAAPVAFVIGDQELELAITGEGGKIDIMVADLAVLRRFAENANVSPAGVAALMADIAKLRELGDSTGALEAVRVALAGSAPIDQLDAVITRFGSPGIDVTYAPEAVLRAIPDLSPADAARIAASPPAERGQFAQLSRYFVGNSRRFSIVARVDWAPGQVSVRRLPIEISTSGQPIVLGGPH